MANGFELKASVECWAPEDKLFAPNAGVCANGFVETLDFSLEFPSSIGAIAAVEVWCVLELDGGIPTATGAGGVGKIPDLAAWFARGLCLTATDVVFESADGTLFTIIVNYNFLI